MSLGYVPGDTFYYRINPVLKLVFWVVITIVPAAFFSDPILLSVVFLSLVLLPCFLAKVSVWEILKALKYVLALVPMYAIINVFFFKSPPASVPYFYLLPFWKLGAVTLESILFLIGVIVKFMVIIVSFRLVMWTTPISYIVRSLTKVKVPWSIVLAMSTGFSYMPVIFEEAQTIQQAQSARGLKLNYRNPIKKFRALIPLIMPLIACSIKRSERLTIAMLARGYGHKVKERTYMKEVAFKRDDYIFAFITAALLAIFAYLTLFGPEYTNYTFTADLIRRLIGEI